MKKWIKKHSNGIWIAFGVLFIINALLALIFNRPPSGWIVVHIIVLFLWVPLLCFRIGAVRSGYEKIANWWGRD